MYIIDLGHNKVVKVSPAGKILTSWGSYGSGPGQFEQPDSVAVDTQGNVYVGDNEADSARIEKFNDAGTFLGIVKLQLKIGSSLVVDSSNELYIANDTSITKLSSTGQVLGKWQFTENDTTATTLWAGGISINAHGDFYAADLTLPRTSSVDYPHIDKIDFATGTILSVLNVWKSGGRIG